MEIKANAKINLALDVAGKRDDGYHEVCMILQEIDLCDSLTVELTDSGEISLLCDCGDIGSEKENIAYKAAKAFLEYTNLSCGCNITLSKNIPVMAGLGGGSSDAASVIMALNKLTGTDLKNEELKEIGLKLGADVPFFIDGKTALAEGIGEKLSPIGFTPDYYAVIIKPEINVSTKKAYEIIDFVSFPRPDVKKAVRALENKDTDAFFATCANVFEYTLSENKDEIEKIKDFLLSKGALFSMMSGSGPTVFGLFETEESAKKALDEYTHKCSFKCVSHLVGER